MQIIISEEQENKLINMVLNEEDYHHDMSNLNLRLKNFLDSNFKKGKLDPSRNDSGEYTQQEVVVRIVGGKPTEPMSDRQLAEYLQAKFQNILPRDRRDQYIKEFIVKWYNKKINPKTGAFLP